MMLRRTRPHDFDCPPASGPGAGEMNLFDWMRGKCSKKFQAGLIYRRGMLKAKLHDNQAALADYTAVIEMDEAPGELRAMALYNRSVVHLAQHHEAEAIGDLEELLKLPQAAANVKTEARRKLLRMQRTTDRAADRNVSPDK
jgi:hypothetical protein